MFCLCSDNMNETTHSPASLQELYTFRAKALKVLQSDNITSHSLAKIKSNVLIETVYQKLYFYIDDFRIKVSNFSAFPCLNNPTYD